jgi:hypothetical protein
MPPQRPRLIVTEFLYQPPPTDPRARAVYDFCLHSRLTQLSPHDQHIIIGDDIAPPAYALSPSSPSPFSQASGEKGSQVPSLHSLTPYQFAWDHPERWQRYVITDRWARIDAALQIGAAQTGDGYLVMPAWDAVWGDGLLDYLIRLSRKFTRNGLPAAVSPVTYWQHSPVAGAHIPRDVIATLNAAFARDSWLWWKVMTDQVQGFWGKMSVIPFAMCAAIRARVDMTTLEDDLIIDTAIRQLGFGSRAAWIWRPPVYRQALPVFDQDGVRRVIERALHYSLNAQNSRDPVGVSTLNRPPDALVRLHATVNPRIRRANAAADSIIRQCADEIRARVLRFGASWVDWGAYRIVVRVGDVSCEVWKQSQRRVSPRTFPRHVYD